MRSAVERLAKLVHAGLAPHREALADDVLLDDYRRRLERGGREDGRSGRHDIP